MGGGGEVEGGGGGEQTIATAAKCSLAQFTVTLYY